MESMPVPPSMRSAAFSAAPMLNLSLPSPPDAVSLPPLERSKRSLADVPVRLSSPAVPLNVAIYASLCVRRDIVSLCRSGPARKGHLHYATPVRRQKDDRGVPPITGFRGEFHFRWRFELRYAEPALRGRLWSGAAHREGCVRQ